MVCIVFTFTYVAFLEEWRDNGCSPVSPHTTSVYIVICGKSNLLELRVLYRDLSRVNWWHVVISSWLVWSQSA